MTTALSSAIARIDKLRTHTIDKGATPAEADTFALQIGRLIMTNPGLQITEGPQAQARVDAPRSSEWIVLEDLELIRRTDKAMLFHFDDGDCGEQFWVPMSVIDFGQSYLAGGSVAIKRWFVEKELGHLFAGAA